MNSDPAAYLAAIVASSNDAVIGMDLEGRITAWNKAAEQLFGYDAADMLGEQIFRLVPDERADEERSILVRLARGERITHLATERIAADGSRLAVSITVSPIRDGNGIIVGSSKTVRDLTEDQRREALLVSILETVPEALLITDAAGMIQSFSPAASRMFGYAPDDVIGRNVSLLMPEPHAAAHDGYLAHYHATGEHRIIGIGRLLEAKRRDGTIFPIELQVGEVRTAGAHLFTGFVRDRSARVERDRRLAELQAELVHVSRVSELGQMASALAHEVSQPLAAIANYASAARRLLPADAPRLLPEILGKVLEQNERARRIVQGLRLLVRKEASSVRRPEHIEEIVDEACALLRAGVRSDFALDRRFEPDLPPIMVDKVQIQQILLNLMRNAVEAMQSSPRRRLSIEALRAGEMLQLVVADTGPGLAPDIIERLFQPFVTSKPDGLGVGLSICRSIAEAHDGTLTGGNGSGGGAVFVLSLPFAAA